MNHNNTMKFDRTVTFHANAELYYEFSLKCKLNKQKIGDRLNALISADLKSSAPLSAAPEPVLFDASETPDETAGENCGTCES